MHRAWRRDHAAAARSRTLMYQSSAGMLVGSPYGPPLFGGPHHTAGKDLRGRYLEGAARVIFVPSDSNAARTRAVEFSSLMTMKSVGLCRTSQFLWVLLWIAGGFASDGSNSGSFARTKVAFLMLASCICFSALPPSAGATLTL